jgi:hypothetical protein
MKINQMTLLRYREIRQAVDYAGYGHEIEWAQTVKAPLTADDFASEAIWVIPCSAMKEKVVRIIQKWVRSATNGGKTVKGNVLGKRGKADAIDRIWHD